MTAHSIKSRKPSPGLDKATQHPMPARRMQELAMTIVVIASLAMLAIGVVWFATLYYSTVYKGSDSDASAPVDNAAPPMALQSAPNAGGNDATTDNAAQSPQTNATPKGNTGDTDQPAIATQNPNAISGPSPANSNPPSDNAANQNTTPKTSSTPAASQ